MIGKTISHYEILEKLGEGGMGVVYKAEDTKLDRFVALKFLPSHVIQAVDEKKRFIHEAKTASALDHPNICTIYEIDETKPAPGEPGDGRIFIAMAYYEGESLRAKIERGPLPVDEATDIALQIGRGLQRAHGNGIVHRDIKPGNIMITLRREVKIVDFGLAKFAGLSKLTKSGMSLGTVAYMSPEQAQGSTVDHRTDIWALGAVLYEMVTGQQPFKGDYEQAVVYSILNEEPEPITGLRTDMPKGLVEIVNKATTKSPDERYQHVEEMLADLKVLTETSQPAKLATKPTSALSSKKKRTFLFGGIAALLILLVALRFFFAESEGTKVIDSIAVLPLDNFSGDPNQEYFADGMTEALIAQLAQISSLRVISRSSVMQYKEKRPSTTEIARELNVTALVEGSVFQDGEQVRITAQLIDAANDRHLFAKSYERDLRDILALQSEVAKMIVNEIETTLSTDEETRLATARPVNPVAHKAYLRGRYQLTQAQNQGSGEAILTGIKSSLEFFERAIEADPDWGLAHASLAEAYHWLASSGRPEFQEFWEKSKAEVLKALEIDESIAKAHISLSFILHRYNWDWVGAERELKRAAELEPNSVHGPYALFLRSAGRFEEAIESWRREEERNPIPVLTKVYFGQTYTCAGQYDQAIEQLRKTVELHPNSPWARSGLADAYLGKSMFTEAIAEAQKAVALSESSGRLADLGRAFAIAGRRDEALEILNQLEKRNRDSLFLQLAELYVALGKQDEALALLQRAFEQRSGGLLQLKCSSVSDSLRDHPTFQNILRGINFPEGDAQLETLKR